MALTPEEENELVELEAQQAQLRTQYETIQKQLTPVEEGPETSMPEALLRSGAQGLSFGLSDEIAALGSAVGGAVTGEGFGKAYERGLEESRAEYKASEEQYPTTSLIGEIGGGIGQAVGLTALSAGTGAPAAAVTGAKTLSNIAKLGKIAKAALIPSVEKSALKNIGTAALSGATYGALTEAGKSEEEGLGRLKEVPMAALTGGAVGGALGGVLEGGKKLVGGSLELLNKAAKEGNLPPSLTKAMDVIKAGKEGKGYVTSASGQRVDDALEKAAEDSVDVIKENLNAARGVKQQILSQVDRPIELDDTLNRIAQSLTQRADEGLSDASPVLTRLQKLVESKLEPESSTLSATSLNDLINSLDDITRDKPDIQGQVQSTLKAGINELKTKLRMQIKPADIQQVLDQNPELQQAYLQYAKNLTQEALGTSPVLSEYEKRFFSGLKRSKTLKDKKLVEQGIDPAALSKEEKSALRTLGKEPKPKKPSKVSQLTEEEIKQQEADIGDVLSEITGLSKQSPLGQLDHVMHKILTASEKLGVKEVLSAPGGSAEALKGRFKIFDVISGSTKETGTGKKALARYREAIQDLDEANPEIGKQFRAVTEPAIKDLENKKFLEGSRLGEGPRDAGALRTILTAPAVTAAFGGNLVAQALASGAAKTSLRPTAAVLSSMKKQIDDRLVVEPNNPVYKFVSESLDNAINQKDESRRAAVINTMMQYESIRKLLKEDSDE
jgi:hypothetical protein